MKTHISTSLAIAALLLLSCSTDSTTMYRLKTSVNPTEGGIVDPLEGEYEEGETVQVKATAHQHWIFSRWEGDQGGNTSTITVMMDRDKNISALFTRREYPLTVEVEGEGTVNERVVQQKTTDYEFGATLELTAVASEGWVFTGWQGDVEGTENPITIEINEEQAVTAIFEKREYPLTVHIEGEGTVIEEVVPAKVTDYAYQTVVSLTAVPSEGWVFSHWNGDITGEENPAQIEVDKATEVTAVFVRDYFTININLGGPGALTVDVIAGNRNENTFEYESRVRITVQPLQDWMQYRFVEWQGDLTGTENPIEVTVTGNITATAVMEQTLFEGEGTVDNPYKVATLEQLQAVRGLIDKHFLQMADIDASETENWNDGRGFQPIAFTGSGSFSGTYNGGGFQISRLKIDTGGGIYTEDTYAGLFGKIKNAVITNLTLTDVDINGSAGIWGTGGLAGLVSTGSHIHNVHITGYVSGTNYVGGLVGIMEFADISSSTADVTVEGNADIGGLIGASTEARIIDVRTNGTVTGNQNVGGLLGVHREGKQVYNSSSSVNVTGTKNVGGLIGSSNNTKEALLKSRATGDVFGSENVGGLIGFFSGNTSIEETYATGNVFSNNGNTIGGLIGSLATDSYLYKSYALGEVTGKSNIGGLIGKNSGQVSETFAAGKVTGTGSQFECTINPCYVGGLIGHNQRIINKSYWDTENSGQNAPAVWDPYQNTTDATGLNTAQMTGSNAQVNMPDFDWIYTWQKTGNYPGLKNVSRENSISSINQGLSENRL